MSPLRPPVVARVDAGGALFTDRTAYLVAFEGAPLPALLFHGSQLVSANHAARELLESGEISAGGIRELGAITQRAAILRDPLIEGKTRPFRVRLLSGGLTGQGDIRVCFLIPLARGLPPNLYDRCGFTRAETRVAHHLSEGLSNREIAARISCSRETVKMHVARILRKSGAPNRAAFVALVGKIQPGEN